MDCINTRVSGAGYADFDEVAAGDILLLAFARADEWFAVFKFSQVFATKIAGNKGPHQTASNASSFAAQIKSLSVTPPASCVE